MSNAQTEDVEEGKLMPIERAILVLNDDYPELSEAVQERILEDAEKIRTLRSRLEEVKGRLSGCESTLNRTRDALQVPEGRAISRYADRLRRRADRLEEERDEWQMRYLIEKHRDTLDALAALDSRENDQ